MCQTCSAVETVTTALYTINNNPDKDYYSMDPRTQIPMLVVKAPIVNPISISAPGLRLQASLQNRVCSCRPWIIVFLECLDLHIALQSTLDQASSTAKPCIMFMYNSYVCMCMYIYIYISYIIYHMYIYIYMYMNCQICSTVYIYIYV